MIRVNSEYYKNHSVIHDRIVFDIKTVAPNEDNRTFNQVLKDVLNNGLTGDIEVKCFRLSGTPAGERDFDIEMQESYTPSRVVLNDEQITNFNDITEEKDRSDSLKREYDSFDRKYVHHENSFEEIPVNPEKLRTEIMDSLGILPTLFNEDDLSIDDKIRYSNEGRKLMWPDFVMEDFNRDQNPYPVREDIEFYLNSLNPYEKRLVRSTFANPLSLIADIRAIREQIPGAIFTKGQYDSIVASAGAEGEWERRDRPSVSDLIHQNRPYHINETDSLYREANDYFVEKLSRAPRVFSEILDSLAASKNGGLRLDDVKAYVDFYAKPGMDKRDAGRAFQQSISKVARLHSPGLYAAAGYISFAEVSDDAINLMSVYLTPEKADFFGKNGFFTWMKAHPELSTNEMAEILSAFDYQTDSYFGGNAHSMFSEVKEGTIDFDPARSVDEILFDVGQLKGKIDAAKFEEDNRHYAFENNDLAIKGRNIVVSDDTYTIMILPTDDYRNFTVGYDTCCCQHYGSAGQSCVQMLTSDPYAGQLVVVRNSQVKDDKWYKGPCLAQAFIWTDEGKDTLVLDNVEFRRTTEENFDHRIKEFNNVFAAWADAMPYLNIHIGTGCNQGMAGWGKRVKTNVDMPATLGEDYVYSDYHSDARTIKEGGEVLLRPDNSYDQAKMKIDETELVPSAYDLFADERLTWLAGCSVPMAEKKELAEAFITDQTEEVQARAYRLNPECIKYIENPVEWIQDDIAALHKDLLSYIRNPLPSVYNVIIRNDPYSILTINDPTEDAWKAALEGNGLLLEHCPYNSEELQRAAVEQNGIAIKFIPHPSIALQRAAVREDVNALSFIHGPADEVVLSVVENNPSLLQNLSNVSEEVQRRVVQSHPTAYLYLKDPARDVTMEALRRDGMMIRNVKYPDEEMQSAAVSQNGFAIKYIHDPSRDIIEDALRQNPKAIKYVKATAEEKQEILEDLER